MKFKNQSKICKVDTEKKLVFGWAQVCTKGGEDYYDLDNQHFSEEVTLGDETDGWVGFMLNARTHKAMHKGDQVGSVVFAFPAFGDIMESLGFEKNHQTGIITGVYVNDEKVLAKFTSGEYTGFSIGGSAEFENMEG